ncbi:hypothetical protein [uncultured Sphaerochaeta sp.]|uniref:hypothetical protein n=1 Tax=uncultured Sphaerochaeta sp. TaxID=886478 RepID=UPI002613FEDB|nr:hypothetical protein [uncultured Sphaerochaeta sp.]
MNEVDRYLYDLFKDTKFDMPSPVKEGASHPSIKEWGTHAGFPFVTRSRPPKRATPPETDIPDGAWDEFVNTVRKVIEIKKRPPAQTERGRIARQEDLDKLEGDIEEYVKVFRKTVSWELREIARCIEGHGTMCAFHYFYFNFFWIFESLEGGGSVSIQPEYRRADDQVLRAIRKSIDNCRGLIGGKRRQFGFSWLLVCVILWMQHFADAIVFFVTKDERDMEKFFTRVSHAYDRLPAWIQKPKGEDSRDSRSFLASWRIDIVKERLGKKAVDVKTMESRIRTGSVRSVQSLAGDTVSMFVMDEPGEIQNHDEIWGIIEPALKKGNSRSRAGCFIGLGTVGKMGRFGGRFKSFYKAAPALKLDKYQIWGWMGMEPDACGNEPKEEIISDINNTVASLMAVGKIDLAIEERQKYPLSEDDMFLSSSQGKLLPAIELEKARNKIEDRGIHHGLKYGLFYMDSETNTVKFSQQEPNPSPSPIDRPDNIGYGQWVIREEPQRLGYEDAYTGGTDPVDMDRDSYKESDNGTNLLLSDIAFCIHKRLGAMGSDDNLPVAIYTGRPADVDDAYYQAYLAGIYYGCKWNIERQKGHRMYAYFKTMPSGLKYIAYGTGVAMGHNTSISSWGYNASEAWWKEMLSLTKRYLQENWEKIYFIRLIYECEYAKEQNTDLLVAWMASLQYAYELDLRGKLSGRASDTTSFKRGVSPFYTKVGDNILSTRALKRPGVYGYLGGDKSKSQVVDRISKKINKR